jgi:hypothetical protein
LVDLVHLVDFVQPNKRDQPNKPNEQVRLADFFNILPNRLIFSLGSVYRGGTMRKRLNVKCETKDMTDRLSVR